MHEPSVSVRALSTLKFRLKYRIKWIWKAYGKRIPALIFIIASIGIMYATFVGIIHLQSAVRFIEQYSSFLQVIASFALVITSVYFSNKMYRNTVKMSEKPAIVELSRFLISPFESYLQEKYKKDFTFNVGLQDLKKEANEVLEFCAYARFKLRRNSENFSFFFAEILLDDFYIILEKMNKKKKWIWAVKELENSCNELLLRIDKLEKNLEELIKEHIEDIRRRYEAINKMREEYPDFQNLLDNLVDESYEYYMRRKAKVSVESLSWHFFDDLFDKKEQELSHDFEEMIRILADKNWYIGYLMLTLRHVRDHLKKEYKLTPSEQLPLVFLSQLKERDRRNREYSLPDNGVPLTKWLEPEGSNETESDAVNS